MAPYRSTGHARPLDPPEPLGPAQLDALFQAHYAPLCEYASQYVKSRELAEEMVQGMFVRLWERQTHEALPALSVAYLYTAVRNRAIGHLRRERVARRFADEVLAVHETTLPAQAPAIDAIHARDLAEAAARAVAALPDRCRLIFLMSRQQRLSYATIAEALGISVTTVETQISRALKRLRTQLGPYLGLTIMALHEAGVALHVVR